MPLKPYYAENTLCFKHKHFNKLKKWKFMMKKNIPKKSQIIFSKGNSFINHFGI